MPHLANALYTMCRNHALLLVALSLTSCGSGHFDRSGPSPDLPEIKNQDYRTPRGAYYVKPKPPKAPQGCISGSVKLATFDTAIVDASVRIVSECYDSQGETDIDGLFRYCPFQPQDSDANSRWQITKRADNSNRCLTRQKIVNLTVIIAKPGYKNHSQAFSITSKIGLNTAIPLQPIR